MESRRWAWCGGRVGSCVKAGERTRSRWLGCGGPGTKLWEERCVSGLMLCFSVLKFLIVFERGTQKLHHWSWQRCGVGGAAWTALGPEVKGNGPGAHQGNTGLLSMGGSHKGQGPKEQLDWCLSAPVFTGSQRALKQRPVLAPWF